LCEIKFSNDEISIEEHLRKLRKKENEFRASKRTKKSIQTILISTWGVKENQYSSAIVTKNLTVDCLFLENE
jgi:hypothetical protein